MWHDNETDIDLLGFDQLVDMVVYLVQQEEMLPLTIGVFGDWGSGKSSLMAMARKRLEADPGYVCVSFSPWQHKDYDDIKSALMVGVMTALNSRRGFLDKADEKLIVQTRQIWKKVAKRVDWFRLAGFAAKGLGGAVLATHGHPLGVGLSIGSLTDIARVVKPGKNDGAEEAAKKGDAEEKETGSSIFKEEDKVKVELSEAEHEPIEQSIDEFRHDFAELLERLKINALVVFVDDIDRCLPPGVIDTLEAIRLFLAVPRTAFVLGADERIVKHAIATRYPEMHGQALDIGRDYLEKMVQIPVRLPPLTHSETETYLNLLNAQLHLKNDVQKDGYTKLVAVAEANRRKSALDVAMNYGIAQTHLGEVPKPLEQAMQVVSRVAPVLCSRLHGNPRQIKRFFNTLVLRQRLAGARGITLDAAVLAKLMILEYFHETFFRQLFQWQSEGSGPVAPLSSLELAASANRTGETDLKLPSGGQAWLDQGNIMAWLQLEPPLAAVNLEPYFYFSRDRVFTPTATARRLSQQLQELLGKLQSESDSERLLGIKDAEGYSADDFRPAYEVLLGRFERDPQAMNAKLGGLIVELAAYKPELVQALAQALRAAPAGSIQSALALNLRTRFGANQPLPRDLQDVLHIWATQTGASNLARAAKRALATKES